MSVTRDYSVCLELKLSPNLDARSPRPGFSQWKERSLETRKALEGTKDKCGVGQLVPGEALRKESRPPGSYYKMFPTHSAPLLRSLQWVAMFSHCTRNICFCFKNFQRKITTISSSLKEWSKKLWINVRPLWWEETDVTPNQEGTSEVMEEKRAGTLGQQWQ